MQAVFLGYHVRAVVVRVTLSGSNRQSRFTQVDTARFLVTRIRSRSRTGGTAPYRYWGFSNGAGGCGGSRVADKWNGDLVLYAHGYAGREETCSAVQESEHPRLPDRDRCSRLGGSSIAPSYVTGTGAEEDTYDSVDDLPSKRGARTPRKANFNRYTSSAYPWAGTSSVP